MKIKDRIALQFTLIVAAILVIFAVLVYSVSSNFREEEFNARLFNKAWSTCRFLIMIKEVDDELLKIIDQNTQIMIDENVLVFDRYNNLIYAAGDSIHVQYDESLLQKIREERVLEFYQGRNQLVGLRYDEGNEPLVALASAHDKFGINKLHNLRNTLIWCLLIGIVGTVLLSIHFAGASLKPISEIIRQISSITAHDLRQRLPQASSPDEIGQLATKFNEVLHKLEQVFEKQRSFVYHASHELRTPLAALKSEIQLAEKQVEQGSELKKVFENLSSDTERLISITNSLLFFARSLEEVEQFKTEVVRMEDILFSAENELAFENYTERIRIGYTNIPEDENHTLVMGNEALLIRVCTNLMDNACKYSKGDVEVNIGTDPTYCKITFRDDGLGISGKDLPRIFDVFFRGANVIGLNGFGIGLSICKRIVEWHGGKIYVKSELNKGSEFTICIPHLVSSRQTKMA